MNRQALAAVETLAEGWAGWMVEMSLQVAVLIAAVAVMTWACTRRSASFRYALWLVVLARLAIPPSLALPSGWGWWLREEVDVAAPAADVSSAENDGNSRAAAPQRTGFSESSGSARADPEPTPTPTVVVTASPSPASSTPAPVASRPRAAPLRPSWAALLMLGWAGVSLTLLGLLVVGGVRTRQWVRLASRELDPRLLRILGRCRWRLEVTQDVELRNSENCTTPLVVGWRRPVILLPARVPQELDDDELEAVILHELNHIVRRDALVNFAQAVLGAIYFFHPLVWWANREIRRLREDACDEMTLAALEGRRKAYGSALVKVSEILGYAAPPLALGVMESKHPARRRLGRILDPNLPLGDRGSWLSLALVAILAIVFLPGGPRPSSSLADDHSADAFTAEAASDGGQPGAKGEGASIVQQAESKQPDSLPADAPPPDEPPLLRYRWTPGASLPYSVNIEAQDAEGIETRSGNISFLVREANEERAAMTFHGSTHGFRRPHPGVPFGPRGPSFDFYSPFERGGMGGFPHERTLTMDAQGRIESLRGSTPLPFVLGDLARLAWLPLPDAAQREWSVSSPIQLELESRDSRFPRSAFLRPPAEILEAQESNRFRLASWSEEAATIERQMEMATVQRVGGKPRLTMTGGGQAVFDRRTGAIQSLRWELKLVSNENYVSRETQIVVTCRRLEETGDSAAPQAEIDLTQALTDLDSPEKDLVLNALRAFQQAEPAADQPTIAARLKPFLTHEDASVRDAGAQAFALWSGEQDVETLVGLFESETVSTRWAAMDALGRLGAKQAARPLAARLAVGIDRVSASRALTQIGPACEDAVLPFLEHEEWSVRLTAINILRDVGSSRSLAALKALAASDAQDNVRNWANLAADAIEKRQAGQPERPAASSDK